MGSNEVPTLHLDKEHAVLSLSRIGPFLLQEDLSPVFPDGLAPGATLVDEHQEYLVVNFTAFYTWSQIMEDEVEDGLLTMLFFHHRAQGWAGELEHKTGTCIGFYFNGDIIAKDDYTSIEDICYGQIYRGYLENQSIFTNLTASEYRVVSEDPINVLALEYVLERR